MHSYYKMEEVDMRPVAMRDLAMHALLLAFLAAIAKILQKLVSRHITALRVCIFWLLWLYWDLTVWEYQTDRKRADRIQEIEDKTFQHTAVLWQGIRSPLEGIHMRDFFYDVSIIDNAIPVMFDDIKTNGLASPSEIEEAAALIAARDNARESFIRTWHFFCQYNTDMTVEMIQNVVVFQNAVARDMELEPIRWDLEYYLTTPPPTMKATGMEFTYEYQEVPGILKRRDLSRMTSFKQSMWKVHVNAELLYTRFQGFMETLDHFAMVEDETWRFLLQFTNLAEEDGSSETSRNTNESKPNIARREWYASLEYLRTSFAQLYMETERLTKVFPLQLGKGVVPYYNFEALEEAMGYASDPDPAVVEEQRGILRKRMAMLAAGTK